MTLPEGFSINPNAADGKTACSDADAHFGTEREAECPEFSKVGSLEIDSSALPAPLPGFVYLGEPLPGNRYRVFLVANGFATHIKLAGTATPDPQTGQLTLTFNELPQSPLTAFNLHIFGSERGLLATPTRCGTYPVTSTFTPWDSALAPRTSSQFFTLTSGPFGSPCPSGPRPFKPGFQAGSSNHTPGPHAPFSLEVTRPDGDQTRRGAERPDARRPLCHARGRRVLLGRSDCPRGEHRLLRPGRDEDPSCPGSSQIGTAMAGVGAGTHPLYVPGRVYLAGPYRGAQLSLVAIVPAVSGPYDLGNVVVRTALHVDPTDAHITAVSDPLPQIIQGIPIRLRSLRVNLDRSGFTLNPTNCSALSTTAQIFGAEGSGAGLAQKFQVANCGTLPFGPRLAFRFSGGTKRTQNPSLTATLTAQPGESNIARTAVTLPALGADRQRPHPEPLHAGPVRGERMPAGVDHRLRKGQDPAARKAARRPRLPALRPGKQERSA